ncbi:MAG: LemA family protein [Candidatus Methanoplasma sp.]|nr:LemA family protein [Candidatus Methanoplasma sp.]
MSALTIVLIALVVVVILLAVVLILFYNNFVDKKLKVENNFSQIKIQCKKRFDLVPNLVETVKGYAKHEQDTLEKVTIARSLGTTAESVKDLSSANNQLTQALSKLFALGEQYPDLKANVSFENLQHELVSIEKDIATSRSFYNDSVMIYNKAVRSFPGNVFAKMLNFKEAEFFDAPEEEMQNVHVKF